MAAANVLAGLNPTSVSVDTSGSYAYVTNSSGNSVSQFSIAANGSLVPIAPPTVVAAANPASVATDPSGRFLYVASVSTNNVATYSVAANGSLLLTANALTGTRPISIVVH